MNDYMLHNYCTLHSARFTLTKCTFLHLLLTFVLLLWYSMYNFYNNNTQRYLGNGAR